VKTTWQLWFTDKHGNNMMVDYGTAEEPCRKAYARDAALFGPESSRSVSLVKCEILESTHPNFTS
jgi:hypothetical protein